MGPFLFFFDEVKAAGGPQSERRSDTLRLCAVESSRDRERGTNWISVNLSPSGGKMQVHIFPPVLSSPDVTCSSFALKLDC